MAQVEVVSLTPYYVVPLAQQSGNLLLGSRDGCRRDCFCVCLRALFVVPLKPVPSLVIIFCFKIPGNFLRPIRLNILEGDDRGGKEVITRAAKFP